MDYRKQNLSCQILQLWVSMFSFVGLSFIGLFGCLFIRLFGYSFIRLFVDAYQLFRLFVFIYSVIRVCLFVSAVQIGVVLTVSASHCTFLHISVSRFFRISTVTLYCILSMINMFVKLEYDICVYPQRCFKIDNVCKMNTKRCTSIIQ